MPDNQFLAPERGGGMVGWAVKQLALWSIGGFVLYALIGHFQLFRDEAPTVTRSPLPPSGAAVAP